MAQGSATNIGIFRIHVEALYDGVHWTEIMDVVPPVDFGWGITGRTPNDRVADAGPLTFAVDNTIENSYHVAGAYTPGGVGAVAGFELGLPIRIWYEYPPTVVKYYKYQGEVTDIEPLTEVDEFKTLVTVADWFDLAGRTLVPGMDVQLTQRSDQLFVTLINAIPAGSQPPATSVGFGMESFPTAFDTAQVEGVYVSGELQKICNSEMGFCYPKGDPATSGVVVFEDRRKRGTTTAPVALFTVANVLKPKRSKDNIRDRVQVQIHPRSFDSGGPVQIFLLNDKPLIVQKTSYGPIICTYKDNSQNKVRIGAKNQLTPVTPTDFLFNTAADGSGTDISANLSIAATHHGSNSVITITNNGSVDGYLTFFRIRGQGYYDEGQVVFEAADAAHQNSLGDMPETYAADYQSDTTISAQMAQYLLQLNNVIFTIPEPFGFTVYDDFTAQQAIFREISDRITIQDAKSGISNDFFIQRIRHVWDVEAVCKVEFDLIPADMNHYWILDSTTYSVLNSTTILAYGLWNQFWILGNSSLGVLGTTSILSP